VNCLFSYNKKENIYLINEGSLVQGEGIAFPYLERYKKELLKPSTFWMDQLSALSVLVAY
jgi:hypothetical protein